VEDGWAGIYDLVTAPEARGRGYGERLTRGLFSYARTIGAELGYLLVVRDNAAANRLYDKLGFEKVYDYWYRVAPIG
ncbi:MAG: family N-acetyltransferase, partial [Paenibacillus sp.]|nr:family N-acetyltransferase [Paenibacillus sp.]